MLQFAFKERRQRLLMKKLVLTLFCVSLSFLVNAQTFDPINSDSKEQKIDVEKVKIFPNPATSVVNIAGIFNCQRAAIYIFDSYGNQVNQYFWEIKNHALSIPVPRLAKGIYTVQIVSENKSISAKFYKK